MPLVDINAGLLFYFSTFVSSKMRKEGSELTS